MSSRSSEGAARQDSFDTLQMPKAAALAAATVRRRIVRGELNAGDALPPESELMRQFGISRPTLREALRILEAEGLISVRRGARGGARVQSPTPEAAVNYVGLLLEFNRTSIEDVLATQEVLEVGAVRSLAEDTPEGAVAALEELLTAEQQALGDAEQLNLAAARFHSSLVELTGSQTLSLMRNMLARIFERHGALVAAAQPSCSGGIPSWQKKSHEVHTAVVELIKNGDSKQAADLWNAHCRANRKVTLAETPENTVLDLFN